MHYKKMILWRVFNIFLLITIVSAEVYSSLFSLKAIIGAERDIPVIINGYVKKESERLDYLKKFAQVVKEHNDKAIRDGEGVIRHPINAFLLFKEMIINWNKAVKIMQFNSVDNVIHNVTSYRAIKRITYPTENPRRKSDGKRIINEDEMKQPIGDFIQDEKQQMFYSVRTTDPDHPRAKKNVRRYEDLLENNEIQRIDMRRDIPPIINVRHENGLDKGVMLVYEALCRQEMPINTKAQSLLYCYYKMDHPYLRLAPFKIEIIRQNPLAVLFHDIMSDEEARIIQLLAKPKACLRLLALYYTGKKINLILFLTIKFSLANDFILSARLRPTEHEIVERIDRRLELATNLEVETAEDLGEGEECFGKLGTGNRIATILIYMTEPEIGGRTVFVTSSKISVPCVKVSY
ncbi:hypothetical protein X798_07598 [Onchocerca flexuosa]|uniref:Prolyl 4-hydroxylase N-terminal domain-containing protein n=1 Tax=Onchocerca flexuosa TaxID=387005 RepID=A0A238BL93_9BILA|nr:hypothetical protein X798_07598 [Onchocerca flexuosa]